MPYFPTSYTLADLVGYLAAGLVAMTFCTTSMIKLRVFAIMSNISFAGYALMANLNPILILHGFLLPVNIGMLINAFRHKQRARRSAAALGCLQANGQSRPRRG
jgi:CRP/FNR family transcriptional regulator, cyclic AMP receptor protein